VVRPKAASTSESPLNWQILIPKAPLKLNIYPQNANDIRSSKFMILLHGFAALGRNGIWMLAQFNK
jgi:hypothetical protein